MIEIMKSIKNYFRSLTKDQYFLVGTLFLALLLRIPRKNIITGSDDGFEILWMAQALANGLNPNKTWVINFLSIFGFYPFSFYPIGYPFLISILLRLGLNYIVISFIIGSLLTIISFFGCYKLSNEFFQKKILRLIFIISYLFAPIFVRVSYLNFSARGPIIAISPWFFYYAYLYIKKSSVIDFAKMIITLIIMAFFHRLWVSYLPLILLLFIIKYVYKKRYSFNYKRKALFLSMFLIVVIISVMILGFIFFGYDERKILSPWFSNKTIFGFFLNLIIDYGLRLGLISVFFPIGVLKIIFLSKRYFEYEENSNELLNNIFGNFSLLIIGFVWSYTLYATVVYLPLYYFYSLHGLEIMLTISNRKIKITILLCFFLSVFGFFLLYSIIILKQYFFIIVFLIIFLVSLLLSEDLINIFIKKTKIKFQVLPEKFLAIFLFCNIVLFGITVFEGQLISSEREYPYSYISKEEISVINFIREEEINGLIYVSHHLISRYIGGYGFLPTINGYRHSQQLYYNLLSKEEVQQGYKFNLWNLMTNPTDNYIYKDPETILINKIIDINITKEEDFNILKLYNIQYLIILKTNGSIYPYHITKYGEIHSLLLESLNMFQSSFETEHLSVWKLY